MFRDVRDAVEYVGRLTEGVWVDSGAGLLFRPDARNPTYWYAVVQMELSPILFQPPSLSLPSIYQNVPVPQAPEAHPDSPELDQEFVETLLRDLEDVLPEIQEDTLLQSLQ